MKKIILLALSVIVLSCPAEAQLQKLPSAVAKEMFASSAASAVLHRSAVPAAQSTLNRYLRRMNQVKFKPMDRMLESYFTLNPKYATPKMLAKNQTIEQEMVRNWVERDFYASQRQQALQQGVRFETVQGKVAYLDYIPYDAQLVLLGEVHEIPWMSNQIETALLQFKQSHPDKNIYYASEFIDATPGEETYCLTSKKEVETLITKRPYYQQIAHRLIAAGVRVVGLENPSLTKSFLRRGRNADLDNTAFAWEAISPAAVQERNTYWAHIIRRIYQQDPDAVVFVHAGLGHTDYNHPSALPWLLKTHKPFVIEFSATEMERLNTLLERNIPIPPEQRNKAYELLLRNPESEVYFIRHMKDKRSALVAGCDLHIKKN